jgi:hypothetical protein
MTESPYDLAYTMAGARRTNPFDRKRQMAQALMQQGTDTAPIHHPLQGVSRLAQTLVGALMSNKIDSDEKEHAKKGQETLAAAMTEPDARKRIQLLSAHNPELGARASAQLAVEEAKLQQQNEGLKTGGGKLYEAFGMSPPSGGQQQAGDAASRIAGIESSGRYDALGPVANQQGDRAYGKYQVMGANVGPWTQEVLGKPMTPQEFIATPQAQEAVFKAKFGQYAQKYGSEEAASRAWFAGEGGMNNPNASDVNGMTVQRYAQKFSGGQPQVAQGNNPQAAPGMPPAPSPQGVAGPAVIAPPAIPEVSRPPQPSPQILQQAEALLKSGQFGQDPKMAIPAARAWVEQQMERGHQDAVRRGDKQYQQNYDTYKNERSAQQAEEKRQREVAGPTAKDMQDVRVARSDAVGIVAALNDFRNTFKSAGTVESAKSAMGFNTPLNTSWNSAALLAKGESLFNLGVLNGPDLEILRRALPDPSTFKGASTSAETMDASVDKIINLIQTRIAAKERQLGLPPTDMRKETETTRETQPGTQPPATGGVTLDAIDAEIARRKGGR